MSQYDGDRTTPPPVYAWPTYPEPTPTAPGRTIAVLALVLAVVPLVFTWLAAIGLAAVVLVRIQTNQARGKGLAIAALIIASLWIVFVESAVIAGIVEDKPRTHSLGAGSEGAALLSGEVSIYDLWVGDCLVRVPTKAIDAVTIVPCNQPHRGEVFATFELAPGPKPSQGQIDRLAEGGCNSRFARYIGFDYGRSKLEYVYVRPSPTSIAVDHEVACIVSDGTKATVGSLRNAKR